MKGLVIIASCVILAVALTGCGKKQEALTESQEPLSVDIMQTTTLPTEAQPQVTTTTAVAAAPAAVDIALPQGPYKPANQDIQIALKNAGFYAGELDGKIGPMTKKAIEEFQKANNLQVDGKVGPKTWAVLSAYLNPAQAKTR